MSKGGRPKGSFGIQKGTSRINAKCAVPQCTVIRRNDKLKTHQLEKVLFDENGLPADISHPNYNGLSQSGKDHTDFFRQKGFDRSKLPPNRTITVKRKGDIASFFTKKARTDYNENLANVASDSSDEEGEAGALNVSQVNIAAEEGESDDPFHGADDIYQEGPDDIPFDSAMFDQVLSGDFEEYSDEEGDGTDRADIQSDGGDDESDISNIQVEEKDNQGEESHYHSEPVSGNQSGERDNLGAKGDKHSKAGETQDDEGDDMFTPAVVLPGGGGRVSDEDCTRIAEAVVAKFGNKVEIDSLGSVSKVIASRVVDKLEEKKSKDNIVDGEEAMWRQDKDGDLMFCLPCVGLVEHPDVPAHLRKLVKGRFGIYKKTGRELKRNMQNHLLNPLHVFCLKKYTSDKKVAIDLKSKNEKACTVIVTNAAHVLKQPSGSAKDFLKLNNKDQLILGDEYALKNDGKQVYFELRKVFHEMMSDKIKEVIKSVSMISVSLDKVTVGGVPFTVVCTYYFWKGELKVFMNELTIMTSKQYDGSGTAEMLCMCLMKTLGLSKEELAEKLEHLCFDGVYANTEERVRGGGSLSLPQCVAEYLGFPADSQVISSSWDLGHRIQLTLGDVLVHADSEHSSQYQAHTKLMYSLMSQWKDSKDGLAFEELAQELKHPVLKQRGSQVTRWARCNLGSKKNFFRNAATIFNCLGRKMNEYRQANDNTKQKEIEAKIKKLTNFEFWAYIIGYTQILNIIVEASLEAQHSDYFATSCISLVTNAMEKIRKLGEKWEWDKDSLVFAGVGSPEDHMINLRNGVFKASVSSKAKIRRARKINTLIQYRKEVEMEEDGEDEDDYVDASDIVVAEIPIEEYALYKEVRVEARLQSLCLDLFEAFTERVPVSDFMKEAGNAFHGDFSWYTVIDSEDGSSNAEEVKAENLERASQVVSSLLSSWKQPISSYYDAETVGRGFCLFVEFKKVSCSPDEALEVVYKKFVEKLGSTNVTEEFRDMFERIQIKTYSEAVCETVGSIMSIARGTGRNCDPLNFSVEVGLSYNLPPLHILMKKFIPEIVKELVAKKEYFRKGDKKAASIVSRLKSSSLSSSLFNFRAEEEKKSKLPIDIFN